MKTITSKWSKPLEFEYIWNFDKLNKRLSQKISEVFENTTGALASSFTFRELTRNSSEIRSDKPYAAAQEFGAQIPERFPVNAVALHWDNTFAMSAAAFYLKPTPYATPSIEAWMEQDIGVEWKK